MADRAATIARFLAEHGWADARRVPLAADASFRRYERLSRADESVVLMDAPPPEEDVRPFARVDRLLLSLGLSAPRPIALDESAGLLLLEDFGDRTFTRVLAEGGEEAPLYRLAVEVLIALQDGFDESAGEAAALPPYDDARLLDEAALFVDWYLPAVTGEATAPDARQAYLDAWHEVFPLARAVPNSLVLRDYHVDNLMVLERREGVAACGLLDFQDAVVGPVTYDLVSLLEDARRDVDPAVVEDILARYLDARPGLDRAAFEASYAVMGAQRNAKIIGIFTRLWRRDGKLGYLPHIARVWRLLERDLRHPALAELRALLDSLAPPDLRRVPEAAG